MTVRERLEYILFEYGMFEQQARKVMDIAIPKIDLISDEYQIEWDADWGFYTDEMYDYLFDIIKKEALVWIDEHIPDVWFREHFVD